MSMIRTIGVLGGKGMLGSDLVKFLGENFETTAIDKENYGAHRGAAFDALVNANGNSRRFWANEHPLEDFEASVVSVYKSLFDFRFEQYIHISSSDVYENHASSRTTSESADIRPDNLSPYGFHKYMSEVIVRSRVKKSVILRSSMILGTTLRKGPFFDIMNGNPLFITLDSRLQLITAKAIADVIGLCAQKEISGEIFNIGGRGSFSFSGIHNYFDKLPGVSPDAERQEYEMNVAKLGGLYPLKTSEEYLKDFLSQAK